MGLEHTTIEKVIKAEVAQPQGGKQQPGDTETRPCQLQYVSGLSVERGM